MEIVAMADGSIWVGAPVWTDVMKSTSGTIATIRNMEVSSLYNSQSDPQCFELVTGACASVASCLNTIGHNVACFTSLLAGEFYRVARRHANGLWLCEPSRQICFCNFWKLSHRRPWHPKSNHGGFCRRSTWLLAASPDSNLGEVYIIGFLKVCSLLWYKTKGDSSSK